jgi:hypothetical protein
MTVGRTICGVIGVGFILHAIGVNLPDSTSSVASTSTTPHEIAQPTLDNRTYGLVNLRQIADASQGNQANFDMHYKNFRFDAIAPFHSSDTDFTGGYGVSFGTGILGDFQCENVYQMQQVAGWRKGQMVRVTGIIDETVFGKVLLRSCSMTPVNS